METERHLKGLLRLRDSLVLIVLVLALNPALAQEPGVRADARPITIAAVGDIMLGSDFPSPRLPPEDGQSLLAPVEPLFRRADLSFANLEGPLCDGGVCVKDTENPNVFAFRTPTRFARTLAAASLKVLSLANNHALDFGEAGLKATKAALTQAGLKFSSKDGEVAEFTVRGVKVGLVALGFGPPPRSIVFPEKAWAEIADLASKFDILIVSVHGGREGKGALHVANETEYFLGENRGNLVRFARGAVDRGADLVLGHGPHVPRALELHKGRLIAYSLGNFCTYLGMNLEGESGYAPLLRVELSPEGEFLRGRIHSFVQKRPGGPKPDEEGKAAALIRRLSLEDFPGSAPLITATGEILPLSPKERAARSEEALAGSPE